MAVFTAATIGYDGLYLDPLPADAAGDEFPISGNTFVLVNNTGATPATLVVDIVGNTSYGEPLPDKDIVIEAGMERIVPLHAAYKDPATKSCKITSAEYASLTYFLFRT